jgi:hypothetical protein
MEATMKESEYADVVNLTRLRMARDALGGCFFYQDDESQREQQAAVVLVHKLIDRLEGRVTAVADE